MAARVNSNGDAWLKQPSSRLALPVLLVAALASALLVFYAVGSGALAAGFAATLLVAAAMAAWVRRLYPPQAVMGEATPDWTVARAAAEQAGQETA